jgi:nucleotide-binding universal stress UspA family protein
MEDDQHASAMELLEMARTEAKRYDITIETVLSSGRVTDSILEAVRTNHIDLLVFGIHAGHGLPAFLWSGTAHELAEGARCDVLGVH